MRMGPQSTDKFKSTSCESEKAYETASVLKEYSMSLNGCFCKLLIVAVLQGFTITSLKTTSVATGISNPAVPLIVILYSPTPYLAILFVLKVHAPVEELNFTTSESVH